MRIKARKTAGNTTELTVKTVGKLTDEESFNNMIIVSDGKRTIRLRDIGNAELGPENEETILRESGRPMIGIAISPQPGANYIAIADEFYKRLEQIKKDLPKEYTIGIALDNTKFVKKSILEVKETLTLLQKKKEENWKTIRLYENIVEEIYSNL